MIFLFGERVRRSRHHLVLALAEVENRQEDVDNVDVELQEINKCRLVLLPKYVPSFCRAVKTLKMGCQILRKSKRYMDKLF